ncbi:Crp/Fnr family transcriptional regulator [Pedobacter sp. ISL-68]|uniref:Crp/Fnr family transcriptional regulator n=1 Tax=unclassified Pedobacter TaxID=2628915 RepID=UPI001BEC47EC|nr:MULTISPECIES: Crp/Fnr family transcriptional regulator [unclassified Pedobacter]MBT2563765.1 Crp/Fnr family transcriptional regulator [Pedobacter sp. ISL-64]MBT2589657.1 Crp/Fnr family transcriptional regulator [Pedobacter sp. ISL-68]
MENLLPNQTDLLETLSQIVPLPSTLQQRIKDETLTQKFKRKHLLLQPGETAKRLYFIQQGLIRTYFIDEHGKECTTWFIEPGHLIYPSYSFITQKPSYEYIEVLQDSKLQSLSWNQINSYYAEFKEANLLGRIITQKHYLHSEQRAYLLRTATSEYRYELLLKKHPNIEQQITQNHIASYLGISRETLSRIRRKKLKRVT